MKSQDGKSNSHAPHRGARDRAGDKQPEMETGCAAETTPTSGRGRSPAAAGLGPALGPPAVPRTVGGEIHTVSAESPAPQQLAQLPQGAERVSDAHASKVATISSAALEPSTHNRESSPSEPGGPKQSASRHQPLLNWRIVERPVARAVSLTAAEARKQSQEALRLASNSGPFEWADIAWDLCDAGQPQAAAAFWTAVLELYDCDARVYLYLADCLSEAGDLERSLEAATRGYRLEPELYEFQEAVLDRLFDLGRDESSFDWIEQPTVTRLEASTRDRIAAMLYEEGECDLFDLRYTLFDEEYVRFDVEGLAQDLESDKRFEVCRFEGAAYATLRFEPAS